MCSKNNGKMSWNYRIMEHKISDSPCKCGIYDVYYSEDGSVIGHTEQHLTHVTDSPARLKHWLELILKTFDKEILENHV